MNIGWEKAIKEELMEEITAVDFPKEAQERVLDGVHRKIRKRRMNMSRKPTGVILAAALVVIGSITAIGAGKIAFYSSSHSINDDIYSISELTAQAKGELGENLVLPENLAEGISFSGGAIDQVDAWDEEHNQVGTFPEVNVYYLDEEGKSIWLTVSKPMEEAGKKKGGDLVETYQEIQIIGTADRYLFLPPDQRPSAEDQQMEEEGKLFISYGSSEVERKTFLNVSWDEGGLHYLIHTFDDIELTQMMELARNVIDLGK